MMSRILIQDKLGKAYIVYIKDWINSLLGSADYLKLVDATNISVIDENGVTSWSNIIAISKRKSRGNAIKIITKSGYEMINNKSFLIWDGSKLVSKEIIRIGDLVPICNRIPNPNIIYNEVFGQKLNFRTGKEFAYYYHSINENESDIAGWIVDGIISPEILFANKAFLEGFVEIMENIKPKYLLEYVRFIKARVGLLPLTFNDIMIDSVASVEYAVNEEYEYNLEIEGGGFGYCLFNT